MRKAPLAYIVININRKVMSKVGEIRLCKEFENLQVLQQDSRIQLI